MKKQTPKSLKRLLHAEALWEFKWCWPEVGEYYTDDQIIDLWLIFSQSKGLIWSNALLYDVNRVFNLKLTRAPSIYKIHQ